MCRSSELLRVERSARPCAGVNDASRSRLGPGFGRHRHSPHNRRIHGNAEAIGLVLLKGDAMAMIARQRIAVIAARLVQLGLPIVLLSASSVPSYCESDRYIERVVTRQIQRMLPA